MTSMKNVMSWNTTSRSGVRLGSARTSPERLPDMEKPLRQVACHGDRLPASGLRRGGGLRLLGGVPEGVDRPVGDLGRLHSDLGDPIAEEGVEEDGRHGE